MAITDHEALQTAFELTRLEGIIPALESSHALAMLPKMKFQPDDIVVLTVSGTTATDGYLYLESINVSQKKNPTATMAFESKTKSGVRRKSHIVGEGYRIYDNSGELEEYRAGYTVERINANTNTVELANGIVLHPWQSSTAV